MATAQSTAAKPAAHASGRGLLGTLVSAVFWLFFSLLMSILIEWIGLTFWWPDQGSQHALTMYQEELTYLSSDLNRSIIVSDPSGFAASLAQGVEDLWRDTGGLDAIAWMAEPPPPEDRFRQVVHSLHDYALATVFITLLFSVRIAILLLSTPVFGLFGLVGLVDGLVERDLRRFGAGRESSYVFHIAKHAVGPLIILTWAIYLSMPISLHPALVILPFATLSAVFIRITASSFKKYL
ncbi:MAG: TIGR03747 family integrating conjugative element membrane protein [Geminicoccales bacterium]